MNNRDVKGKILVLFETAKDLSESDVPIVRQRAEAILGLLQDLLVTVVGEDN